MTDRTEYISGLRKFADWMEANPDVAVPDSTTISWFFFGHDESVDMAKYRVPALALARQMPRPIRKWDTQSLFRFGGNFDGLPWEIVVARAAVCSKTVRHETVKIKRHDPKLYEEAVKDLPLVEVEETREIVEWDCGDSILAPETKS